MKLEPGYFYFIKDTYFEEFKDTGLMRNKENKNGKPHDRPAYYSYFDTKTNLNWLIPISSQIPKYEAIYNKKVKNNPSGICDTIHFAHVLGKKSAFLIQNMFPILPEYIKKVYKDRNTNKNVIINNNKINTELNKKAKKILTLVKKGHKNLIFPDVLSIENSLLEKLNPIQSQCG